MAVQLLYALNGWFIGMQNTRIPMVVAIVQNVVNIPLSLLLVFVFGMGIAGVALGGFTTVILLQLFTGSVIMISIGIIGYYIARIYEEVKGRPKYIINRVTDNIQGNVTGNWKK